MFDAHLLSRRAARGRTAVWTDRAISIRVMSIAMLLGVTLAFLTAAGAAVAPRPLTIDWHTSPLDLNLRGMNGERFQYQCPAGKPNAYLVTGSSPYTDASSICSAAVQRGVIKPAQGGVVTIEILPGRNSYKGAIRNHVRSSSYSARWSSSFVVLSTPKQQH